MAKEAKACKYTSIGGQALIEGIMMKSPDKTAMAVRKKDGTIDISILDDKKMPKAISKIPILRGVVAFVYSMIGGFKALTKSADISGYADEVNEETGETEKLSSKAWAAITLVAGLLAIVLCVVLFMYLPRLAVGGLQRLFRRPFSSISRSLIEQGIKLVIFLAYIIGVSFMKDIHRVFSYHGAEHKTIFAYEAKLPLTVENVRAQKRFHPRCGTSFLILMLLVSVVFSTVLQILFKNVYSNAVVWTAVKLLIVPLICGTGYEVLKWCGRHDNIFTRVVSAPGLWVQRITTKEPDDSMIEIAIAAMNEVIPENQNKGQDESTDTAAEEKTDDNI